MDGNVQRTTHNWASLKEISGFLLVINQLCIKKSALALNISDQRDRNIQSRAGKPETTHLTPASMEQFFSRQKFVRGFFEPANLDNYVHEQLKAVLQSNSRKHSADAQDQKIAQA